MCATSKLTGHHSQMIHWVSTPPKSPLKRKHMSQDHRENEGENFDYWWVAIVDGEQKFEADTREEVESWATANDIDPDRIATKADLKPPLFL